MKTDDQRAIDLLECALKNGHIPASVEVEVANAVQQCRAHQRADRSALLRMAGNIAAGMVGTRVITNYDYENAVTQVAGYAVKIACAILEEVDRGE